MDQVTTPTKNCRECGAPTTITVVQSMFTAFYDCMNCGEREECEHEHTSLETVSTPTFWNGEIGEDENVVEVCDDCGVSSPFEPGEPDDHERED